jgi:hypothetical protein
MRVPLALVALAALPSLLDAQQILTLTAGFTPDPQTLQVKAGGSIAVAEAGRVLDLGDMGECDYGYIAGNAVGISYSAGSLDLYVYAESGGDTMLLIKTPGGDMLCDDDGHGSLNPLVHIEDPESGLYVVWAGSYSNGAFQDATLYVSELNPGGGDSGGESMPNVGLDPYFGSLTIDNGFAPDPHVVEISAGGSIDLDVDDCSYGWVGNAPDFNLTYDGSGGTLHFWVRSSEDTMLLVNKPDATWVCDDDSLGDTNPVVTITGARSGVYNIWVGTYSEREAGDLVDATLYLSTKAAK